MRGSLRLRLLVALTVILLFGTVFQAAMAYRGARAAADDQFDYQMDQLAASLAQGLLRGPDPAAQRLVADISNFDFIVQVWSAGGVRVYATESRVLIPPDTPSGLADWQAPDGRFRVVTVHMPGRIIQVAQDQAIRARLAGEFARRAIAPIALWAPLVLIAGLWLLDRALRPLRRVREQVAARRVDDLSPLDASALPNEIRPVIIEFNDLLARLKTAFDAQGRFVADAAHELRTPLAALRLQVQALAREGLAPAASIARVSQGLDRTTRLVDQLLVLAREDYRRQLGEATVAGPPVDLVGVATEAIEILSDLAVARTIDLGLARADPGRVDGDRDALGILARNLIDNAIKYTPRGGTVDVRIVAEAGPPGPPGPPGLPGPCLVVEDSGPGVDAASLDQLFDRFHRSATIEPDDGPTGSGLGLAIVRAIAERHGARVTADRSPGLGGLRIMVCFPAPAGARGSRPA